METVKDSGNVKKHRVIRILVLIGVAFMLIFSVGAILALAPITMVKLWIPAVVALILAAIAGTVLWRLCTRLTGISHFAPNYLLSLIFLAVCLTALFFSINACFLTGASPRKERVTVERKYRERHHTTRRTGRHSYVQGPDYYTYHLSVVFPDGTARNLQLPYSVYKDIPQDSSLTLSLRRGILGAEVLQTSDIPDDNPVPPAKKRKRCRFFGTSGKK
ncbi:MAG: hypothetical protein K2J70_07600 [Muribaculaceae bacterium]|nr:hypothetical protein [Muribaculaceae bacterium]